MTDAVTFTELGMINDLKQMEIISQNLANATTNGYKRDLPVTGLSAAQFDSLLSGFTLEAQLQRDLVPTLERRVDPSQGALKYTGNPLDVAIEGEGFFEIDTTAGIRYTRRGGFKMDVNGRLVTADGYAVRGLNGEIHLSSATPRIDSQGRIWDNETMVAQLKLVRFPDGAPLLRVNGGLYVFSGEGATDIASVEGVRQGHLEASNVNAMDEMVRMITTTRHFETSQKVITNYDEMIGEAISTIAEF